GLPCRMEPAEGLEYALLRLLWDSRAVVLDLDVRGMSLLTGPDRDAPRELRAFDDEFGGIADQIRQYRAQGSGRARDLEWRDRLDRQLHLDGLEPRPDTRDHGVQHVSEICPRAERRGGARPGELEQRFDDLIRALELALDGIEMGSELRPGAVSARGRQHLQGDRAQRISQVMRHAAGEGLELGIALALHAHVLFGDLGTRAQHAQHQKRGDERNGETHTTQQCGDERRPLTRLQNPGGLRT